MKKIAIIGGGASGLFISHLLDKSKFSIKLFEKNNKLGKKLLATGNGKCNITNQNIHSKFFHSKNIKFTGFALSQFDYFKCKKEFQSLGVELISKENGRTYPLCQTASSVVEQLKYPLDHSSVEIKLNTIIDSIEKKDDKYLINGSEYFDIVILANGSNAMPKLGGTASGYELARSLGHTIINPFASLVQLETNDKDIALANGVKLEASYEGIQKDLLFTKYGISGNLIIDISRDIALKLQSNQTVNVTFDLFPHHTKEQLSQILIKRFKTLSPRPTAKWLEGIVPYKFALYLIKKLQLKETLVRKDINTIVYNLKNFSLEVVATKGFDSCEVCAGGVDTNEIDNTTMQSKRNQNLYIIGELADVDGDCGGYNLHWAWASAYLCAKNINHQG